MLDILLASFEQLKEKSTVNSSANSPSASNSDDDDSDTSTATLPSSKRIKLEPAIKSSNKTVETQTELMPHRDITEITIFLGQQDVLNPSKRDNELIHRVMRASYPDRRNYILQKAPCVTAVKQIYPSLFYKPELIAEFGRIKYKKNIESFYYENLTKLSENIINLIPDRNKTKKEFIRLKKDPPANVDLETMRNTAALMMLPLILKESWDSVVLYGKTAPNGDFPVITCDGNATSALENSSTFRLFAEQSFIVESKSFCEIILLFIAVFYCFDMQYPEECRQTTGLIEIMLMKVAPEFENSKMRDAKLSVELMP